MSVSVRIEAQYQEFLTATKMLKEVFAGAMDGMRDELKAMSDQAKVSMKGTETAAEQMANIVRGRFAGLNGLVNGVQTAWAQLAVVVGAAAFLGKAAQRANELTVEAQKLGRALGVSATQASVINMALGDVYATSDDYLKLVRGLDQQLKINEKTLQQYGIQTRDSNGAFRDQNTLVMESLEKLRGFKEGTDRNIAATQIFGKGVNVSNELLSLNAEKLEAAREKAQQLGLIVGQENVQNSEKFRAAMNDMHDILDAVMNAIGQTLLPVLGDLAEWFNTHGPTALLAIKVAIGIVISLFHGLAFAVKAVWAVVVMAFKNMAVSVSTFADMFRKVMAGDFSGALEVGRAAMGQWGVNAGEAFDKVMAGATSTRDSLAKIWDPIVNGSKVEDSGVEKGGTEQADNSRKGKDDDGAAAHKAALAAEMRAKREAWQLTLEKFKGEEAAAKDNLTKLLEVQRRQLEAAKSMWGEQSKEAQAAANKIAETQRKLLEQERQLNDMRAGSTRNLERIRIDSAEATAEAEYQTGQITALRLLELKQEFENQRYELDREALMNEAIANQDRILDHEQTLLAIEELDAQHRAKTHEFELAEIEERHAMQQGAQQVLEQGFSNAIMNMVRGTMTFKQAMKSMFSEILTGFISMLAQWAARQLAAYVLDRAMHKTNLLAKKVTEKAAAASTIGTQAAVAGASGVASWAAAPWPINMGAPAFGAAMFAASGMYAAGLAAEKGFDIPAGVNPVTQLHQKEMVLPAEQADVIRGMASGRTTQGSGDSYQIVTHDPRGFADYLRRNPASLTEGVRYATRRGHAAGMIKL